MSAKYVIPQPPQAALAVAGSSDLFPVRRIWCVGRNYLEHIKEMGQDEREPPFFFAKPADAIVHDGGTVPYPPLTNDLHHEVEMVVALKSGGRNIPKDKALDCVWGYGVGIDLTRRDLQIASRNIKRPWEIGKAFDGSAPCGPLQPASKIGHPSKGRIWLKVNGEVKQDGDLEQMIWNVPEIIWKLSEMVALEAGDIIMTGTPAGVSALQPGHKLECEVEGVGKVSGDDRAEAVALSVTSLRGVVASAGGRVQLRCSSPRIGRRAAPRSPPFARFAGEDRATPPPSCRRRRTGCAR